MKIETKDLIGPALDWAVAVCEGVDVSEGVTDDERYSDEWGIGGPIIDRKLLMIEPVFLNAGHGRPKSTWAWKAYVLGPNNLDDSFEQDGPTALVAAMRCFVASKLGDEVEVPEALLK